MPPLAVKIDPSAFPLRFIEIVAFRGDFQDISPNQPVSPKGLAYHPALDRIIVSLSPRDTGSNQKVQILNQVIGSGRDIGERSRFSPGYHMFRAVESPVAIVPALGPPVTAAGFTPGDVFVGQGPGDQISRLRSDGSVVAETWANTGTDKGLWGGLVFDTSGNCGGQLIAVTTEGDVFKIDSSGGHTLIVSTGKRLEGVAIAPSDFGPHSGKIVLGVEGRGDDDPESGKIYALDSNGNLELFADIGYFAEDIQFVPPAGGTYYVAEISFERERENRLLAVSAPQFLNRLGSMIVINELSGEFWEIAWDGFRYTLSSLGLVTDCWSSEGFARQGTELEGGCFAALKPTIPNWTAWSSIPGGFTTDRRPAVAVDAVGDQNIHLLIKRNDNSLWVNTMNGATGDWMGWQAVPGGLTTNHAPALARHNNVVYALAINDNNAIMYQRLFVGGAVSQAEDWIEVPGGMRTDTAVAATCANGRLVLCAKSSADGQLYIIELAPGGELSPGNGVRGAWSDWRAIPGSRTTDVAPGLICFQDELYVLIKDVDTGQVLTKVRTVNGYWTDWAKLPGGGATNASITAAATADHLYVFVKGTGPSPFYIVASRTGTWHDWWLDLDGSTDAALAAIARSNQVFLFVKGMSGQVHIRNTI